MEFGHATEERGEEKKGEKWEMRFELRYVYRGQGIGFASDGMLLLEDEFVA